MSSTIFSTLNPNLKPTQIGVRCSGTKKCSQRYQIDHFCQGFFSSHSTFVFFHNPGKGSFGFAHSMSDIPMTPRCSLRMFRNWRLACSELHIKTDFEIYGSSIGVCNYVIGSNPINQINSNQIESINPSIKSNRIKSNQINQSINNSNQINWNEINRMKLNQINQSINQSN